MQYYSTTRLNTRDKLLIPTIKIIKHIRCSKILNTNVKNNKPINDRPSSLMKKKKKKDSKNLSVITVLKNDFSIRYTSLSPLKEISRKAAETKNQLKITFSIPIFGNCTAFHHHRCEVK